LDLLSSLAYKANLIPVRPCIIVEDAFVFSSQCHIYLRLTLQSSSPNYNNKVLNKQQLGFVSSNQSSSGHNRNLVASRSMPS
jgi:hypothetical protein